jgi:hypothetical protein
MKIFISYRRDDSAGHAGRLYDSLTAHFGPDSVFMDLSAIDSGENFARAIESGVGSCDALIALIGDQWLSAAGPRGRRLDDAGDFVRAEIASALAQGTPVIPVLVEGATMPQVDSLPDALKPLAQRQAHELSDHRWSYDVRRLIEAAEKLAGPTRTTNTGTRLAAAAAVLLVLIAGAILLVRARGENTPFNANAVREADVPTSEVRLDGAWSAEVRYYANSIHEERFEFTVDGHEVLGTASFLGTPRAILEGTLTGDTVRFSTRSQVCYGSDCTTNVLHSYRGTVAGDTIAFYYVLSENGIPEAPREFTARRIANAAPPATSQ